MWSFAINRTGLRGQNKEFEDTKEVIRTSKSKKDRQHNDQMKKDKKTNNDLQNIQIHGVNGGERRCSGRVTVPTPLVWKYISTMKQLSMMHDHLL